MTLSNLLRLLRLVGLLFFCLGMLHLIMDLFAWGHGSNLIGLGLIEADIAYVAIGFCALVTAKALKLLEDALAQRIGNHS